MMMICQAHALRRKPIDIGCLVVLTSITSNIGVTEIIRHDEDNIGLRYGLMGGAHPSQNQSAKSEAQKWQVFHGRSFEPFAAEALEWIPGF